MLDERRLGCLDVLVGHGLGSASDGGFDRASAGSTCFASGFALRVRFGLAETGSAEAADAAILGFAARFRFGAGFFAGGASGDALGAAPLPFFCAAADSADGPGSMIGLSTGALRSISGVDVRTLSIAFFTSSSSVSRIASSNWRWKSAAARRSVPA